ncbi:hypothetical protein HanXRQr2_Chr04g0172261 [Helianthus annuus]|uniref:Uncharacterized protein n=1 Tax=Helianthus annuus TaxID=4232 RepID=A0A9K3NRZ5_HELAN|nr:hypothetical protein HanXRQr2_Chr04g0172261 [Helianthus annuus]
MLAMTLSAGDADMARQVVDPEELWIRKLSCGNDMLSPGNIKVIVGTCFPMGTV